MKVQVEGHLRHGDDSTDNAEVESSILSSPTGKALVGGGALKGTLRSVRFHCTSIARKIGLHRTRGC